MVWRRVVTKNIPGRGMVFDDNSGVGNVFKKGGLTGKG